MGHINIIYMNIQNNAYMNNNIITDRRLMVWHILWVNDLVSSILAYLMYILYKYVI